MPIIGLVGGIAPPSTIDYYNLLIQKKHRAKHEDSFLSDSSNTTLIHVERVIGLMYPTSNGAQLQQ